ncbi:hypothetical protein [uncultured Selenomonas sp.]|uniref:vWA domain-containing protein n=1 Tax=uncultured Selenomonas sp. TaxID=159275 RepID=UPI0025F4F962|nr:hypothetical protein [uncultured Selenomonas sp.]
MKENEKLTELVFILDCSGSMHGLEKDTIGGFNSLLAEQKGKPGRAMLSTVLFASDSVVIHNRVPISEVKPLKASEYQTGGSTALLDAIGGAIHHIGNCQKYAAPEDRPTRTLFVIITDGEENDSKRYSFAHVKHMVERQQKRFDWEFLFLGANMDAIAVASQYGIDAGHAVSYRNDGRGQRLNYEVVTEAVTNVRCCSAPLSADWKRRIEEDQDREDV